MVSHLDRYWEADVKYDLEIVWQLETALGIRMLVVNCFGVATINNIIILDKFTENKCQTNLCYQ